MRKTILFIFCSLLTIFATAQSVQPPFRDEINAFKKQDSLHTPPSNAILLIGSSSFTKWTDVQSYFPSYPIINRGFGGSSLPDVIRYANEIIFPYAPKQILIYCGENDIAASDTVTAAMVLERFVQLFSIIRAKLPNTPLVFISIKPSPSRWKFQPVIVEANKQVKAFLDKQRFATFVNVYDAMLNTDGSLKPEIYVSDQLHMNEKGYAIWQKILLPVLKR